MIVLALALISAVPAGEPYAEVWELAAALEAEGQLDEAVAVLEEAAEAWPQDYALAMRLGDLSLRAGELEAARRWYRVAVVLSEGAPPAREALARTRGTTSIEGLLAATGITAGPWRGGVSAGAWFEHAGPRGILVQGGYRYSELLPAATHPADATASPRILADVPPEGGEGELVGPGPRDAEPPGSDPGPTDGTGPDGRPGPGGDDGEGDPVTDPDRAPWWGPSGGGGRVPWTSSDPILARAEHVVHLGLGHADPRRGLLVHVVGVAGGGGERAGAAALSARWSPWGDLVLTSSWAAWPDARVASADLGWRLPVAPGLAITPGGGGQWIDGTWLWTTRLASSARLGPVHWTLGGHLGASFRPILVEPVTVYDLPGLLGPGAWTAVEADLGRGWHLEGGWEWSRLYAQDHADTHTAWLAIALAGP